MIQLHSLARISAFIKFSLWFCAILVLTGCPGEVVTKKKEPLKRIIILTNTESPFWDACRSGMQDAEKDFKLNDAGYKIEMVVNDGTVKSQIDTLLQYSSQSDIAAVGVSVLKPTNARLAEVMTQLREKGIEVVTVDSDGDPRIFEGARYAYLGTQNIEGGKALGTCARLINPEGGGYVTFVGKTGQQNAIERVGGFAEGAGSKFKALDNMGDDTDKNRARENVRNAMQNFEGDLKTLVGIWSYNAPAIVDIVREKNSREKFTIVTFDAEPGAIQEMGKGMIDAMVVQNPYAMGYEGVRMMKALLDEDQKTLSEMLPHFGKSAGDIFDTGLKVVVPDEKSLVKKEAFGGKIQYLTLEEFKAWLKKYGLKGS